MKKPISPPNLKPQDSWLALKTGMYNIGSTTEKGEYLHWDILRHLTLPEYISSSEEWWFCTKLARRTLYKKLPFTDINGRPFVFAISDSMHRKLRVIDQKTGVIHTQDSSYSILNSQNYTRYLIRSMIEEAISSSQIEGAVTTRRVAKEMLQENREPRDVSERMILNNYYAMEFIRSVQDQALTTNIIIELHRILTDNILPEQGSNQLRISDDVKIWGNNDELLHVPPFAKELPQRLDKLCEFANASENQEKFFMHPVIKAIILHFILAYDHPFTDGNGRTARALFYWYVVNQNYGLMEFISISEIIKKSRTTYYRAFLYTETDDNDLTYFIDNQLNGIIQAIENLHLYIESENKNLSKLEQTLFNNKTLAEKLNDRQIALIKHALKHPYMHYKIEGHRQSHGVTYDTARNDLINLSKLGLLLKQKIGRAFVFTVPKSLREKIM